MERSSDHKSFHIPSAQSNFSYSYYVCIVCLFPHISPNKLPITYTLEIVSRHKHLHYQSFFLNIATLTR